MGFNRHTGHIKVEVWNGQSGMWHYNVLDVCETSIAHGETRCREDADRIAREQKAAYREQLKKNS